MTTERVFRCREEQSYVVPLAERKSLQGVRPFSLRFQPFVRCGCTARPLRSSHCQETETETRAPLQSGLGEGRLSLTQWPTDLSLAVSVSGPCEQCLYPSSIVLAACIRLHLLAHAGPRPLSQPSTTATCSALLFAVDRPAPPSSQPSLTKTGSILKVVHLSSIVSVPCPLHSCNLFERVPAIP